MDVITVLRRFVAGFSNQRDAASALGISQAYLSDLLHENRQPSDALLERLGYRRDVTIKPISKVS